MTYLCVIKYPHDALGRHKFLGNVIITELSRIARGLGIELGNEGVKGHDQTYSHFRVTCMEFKVLYYIKIMNRSVLYF